MGATLEALLALREIELQIAEIRRQLGAKERSVARQTEKLRAAEQTLEAGRANLKQGQVSADAADLDLKSRDAHVAKLRDSLNSVRTNKEYAAIMSQLNNEKADRSRQETRALELLGEVETRRKAVGEQEALVREETQRLANIKAQLEQSLSSFAARLTALEKQRALAADQLDAKALDMFNRLSDRYEGEVMAKVVQVHPRRQEYICDGCHMSLSAERANALMTRDDVQTCGSCGRILFIDKGR